MADEDKWWPYVVPDFELLAPDMQAFVKANMRSLVAAARQWSKDHPAYTADSEPEQDASAVNPRDFHHLGVVAEGHGFQVVGSDFWGAVQGDRRVVTGGTKREEVKGRDVHLVGKELEQASTPLSKNAISRSTEITGNEVHRISWNFYQQSDYGHYSIAGSKAPKGSVVRYESVQGDHQTLVEGDFVHQVKGGVAMHIGTPDSTQSAETIVSDHMVHGSQSHIALGHSFRVTKGTEYHLVGTDLGAPVTTGMTLAKGGLPKSALSPPQTSNGEPAPGASEPGASPSGARPSPEDILATIEAGAVWTEEDALPPLIRSTLLHTEHKIARDAAYVERVFGNKESEITGAYNIMAKSVKTKSQHTQFEAQSLGSTSSSQKIITWHKHSITGINNALAIFSNSLNLLSGSNNFISHSASVVSHSKSACKIFSTGVGETEEGRKLAKAESELKDAERAVSDAERAVGQAEEAVGQAGDNQENADALKKRSEAEAKRDTAVRDRNSAKASADEAAKKNAKKPFKRGDLALSKGSQAGGVAATLITGGVAIGGNVIGSVTHDSFIKDKTGNNDNNEPNQSEDDPDSET